MSRPGVPPFSNERFFLAPTTPLLPKRLQVGGGKLWMGVPSILYHQVDENSPLHGLTREDLDERDMEVLVILDGIDETTATPVQARTRGWVCARDFGVLKSIQRECPIVEGLSDQLPDKLWLMLANLHGFAFTCCSNAMPGANRPTNTQTSSQPPLNICAGSPVVLSIRHTLGSAVPTGAQARPQREAGGRLCPL